MLSPAFVQDYIEEIQEHLLAMEKSLLILEKEGADQAQIAEIFRAAHSLKGASAYMGFERLAAITHEMETLISEIQRSSASITPQGVSVLLQCMDVIANSMEFVRQNGAEPPLDPSFVDGLRSAFSQTESPAGQSSEMKSPPAADQVQDEEGEELEFDILIQEEDEELLAIFIQSFLENYFRLLDLVKSSPGTPLSADETNTACEIVKKLSASAHYMDYQQIVPILNEWEKGLHGESGLNREQILGELQLAGAKLEKLIPGLKIPVPEESGPVFEEPAIDLSIQEEDEELLAIFIKNFQENYSSLLEEIKSSPSNQLSADKRKSVREILEKMIASARYMDYQPLAGIFSDWQNNLDNQSGLDASQLLDCIQSAESKLKVMIPGLELAPAAGRESGFVEPPLEDEDQELFSIFLDSFQQKFSILAELVLSPNLTDDVIDGAMELTRSLCQTCHYMDYESIVDLLKRWNESLEAMKGIEEKDFARIQESFASLCSELPHRLTGFVVPDFGIKNNGTNLESLDADMDLIFHSTVPVQMDETPAPSTPDPGREKHLEKPEVVPPAAPVQHVQVKKTGTTGAVGKKERTVLYPEEIATPVAATLRVDAQKVDQLINQVGELVVTRSEFIQTATLFRDILRDLTTQGVLPKSELRRLRHLGLRLNESTQSLGRVSNDLQDSIMRVRMLPIRQLFERFPRIVRDQALKLGKRVELIIEGGETEIDKRVLERMNDPLIQFIRNALVHGIENPTDRKIAGKPDTGIIRLAAYQSGDYVAIEIQDDGRGIDIQRLREVIQNRGDFTQQEIERLTDEEIVQGIFLPGISTYSNVDGLAGRGVGLDVVKENVENMSGSIDVESVPGQGTQFTIRIPLTVAIIRALLVKEADQIYTLPLNTISEILRYRPDEARSIEGFPVISLRGKTIPLVDLRRLLNMGNASEDSHKFVVIVATSFREVGLVVDGLMGEREVVIKSIDNGFQPIQGFSGATVLGDGRVSLIIDVSAMLKMMKSSFAAPLGAMKSSQLIH